jgi:hypothetical protein
MSQINVDIIRSRTGTAATCDKGLVISGVTTSTSFSGSLTGTASTAQGLSGSPDITIGNLTGVAGTYSGVVKVTDSTEATSTTTGSVIITGGVGIAKSLFVGGNISVGGTLTYEDVQNVDSIGIITARDDINIVTDSKKLNIGAGADLQLFHNGTNSLIKNATGDLAIEGDSLKLRSTTGGEAYVIATLNGSVDIYFNDSKKFETTAHGTITSGIHTVTVGTDLDGYKVEEGNSDTSTALNGEFDFELENGHVQRYSTATGGNYFPDFRVSSSQSLDSVMDIGDVVTCTLIVASSSHYCTTGIKIDDSTSNLDIDWIGGSAPSAANGSGFDVYSFTIIKTGSAPAYHIIGNTSGVA